jgi:hypothetical protein
MGVIFSTRVFGVLVLVCVLHLVLLVLFLVPLFFCDCLYSRIPSSITGVIFNTYVLGRGGWYECAFVFLLRVMGMIFSTRVFGVLVLVCLLHLVLLVLFLVPLFFWTVCIRVFHPVSRV